jgi:hypothetical protein
MEKKDGLGTEQPLDIDCPMVQAWKAGTTRYRPVFRGRSLEIENGSVEVTLRNLREIDREIGLRSRVTNILVGPRRQTLIVFSSGETYLATGFSVGSSDMKVRGLAEFVRDTHLSQDSVAEIFETLASLPEEYEGDLPFDNLPL